MKEVIALILGQIDATKDPVKAVLLVGGFGQNSFLRDSVRQAVSSKGIEVMQSPNGWVNSLILQELQADKCSLGGQQLFAVL